VDAVLTASRSLIAVATRSLGAAAEEVTIAQYRALVVLASRGTQRMADLAAAPGAAGEVPDRRWPPGPGAHQLMRHCGRVGRTRKRPGSGLPEGRA